MLRQQVGQSHLGDALAALAGDLGNAFAWDLVIDPVGARIFETSVAARGMLNRSRRRLRGGGGAGGGSEPSSEAA